jgi:hypothetical protein
VLSVPHFVPILSWLGSNTPDNSAPALTDFRAYPATGSPLADKSRRAATNHLFFFHTF